MSYNTNYTNHASANSTTNTNYYDFNTAEGSSQFDLIHHNTLAKVSLHIRKGAYNDPTQGWTDGFATCSNFTGAVYLACEFTVLEGEYAKRKVWCNIGLYSEKNNNLWGSIGRSFIRSILNSAKGFTDKDQSAEAKAARQIESFAELEGLVFIAKISVDKDQNGNEYNVIKSAITPEHKEYAKLMGKVEAVIPTWA